MAPLQGFSVRRLFRVRRIINMLPLLLLLSLPNPRLSAQTGDQKQVYFSVSFIKVHPEKEAQYRELLKKYGKKINQYFYKNGAIMGWYMNQVIMPSGAAKEYDYAAVNVSTNFKELLDDTISIRAVFKKVFPGMTDKMFDSIAMQYQRTRTVVKREIYRSVTGLHMNPGAPPTKYVSLDFMKTMPGKDADYEKMEKETWMPIHKERVNLGVIKDWEVYAKLMPYNANDEFDYVTGQFFDDLSAVENPKYQESFTKAWPNRDAGKMIQDAESTRKMVKNELWSLIDYVDASNMK